MTAIPDGGVLPIVAMPEGVTFAGDIQMSPANVTRRRVGSRATLSASLPADQGELLADNTVPPGFPPDGDFPGRFPAGEFSIPGSSDVARIRPTGLSGSRARLWIIGNGESPRTMPGPRALERGEAPFGRHLMGGDRGMKSTRVCGTARASAPFHLCDHTIGFACGYAPTPLSDSRGSAMT